MRQLKYGLIITAVLLAVGCASTGENVNVPVIDVSDSQSQSGGAELAPKDSPYIKKAQPTKPGGNPAVQGLMKQAARQQQAGDYVGAARTLERAIRISPRYGELYYRLSEVRFGQRNFGQSEQLCRKAISLASGDSDLLARSRLLMAKAKQTQGDY
ncbi:MAG: tetratricopeptide repeat protein [Pseudomonadales bacterium]